MRSFDHIINGKWREHVTFPPYAGIWGPVAQATESNFHLLKQIVAKNTPI